MLWASLDGGTSYALDNTCWMGILLGDDEEEKFDSSPFLRT